MNLKNSISILLNRMQVANAEFNEPLKRMDKREFENEQHVTLPNSLAKLLEESNGIYCQSEMFNLRSLNEFKSLYDTYELNRQYLIRNDLVTSKNPIWKLDEDLKSIKWIIEDVKSQFLFSEYNFGGTFWSINLNGNSMFYEQILMLSFHTNDYKVVSSDFKSFMKIYNQGEIEHLL